MVKPLAVEEELQTMIDELMALLSTFDSVSIDSDEFEQFNDEINSKFFAIDQFCNENELDTEETARDNLRAELERVLNLIKVIEETAIARIEGKEGSYATLQAAIEATNSGDQITLLADTEESINISRDITLNLAEYAITSLVTNSGTLRITTNGNGRIKNDIYNTGTLTINAGTFCTTGNYALLNDHYCDEDISIINLNGGSIQGTVQTQLSATLTMDWWGNCFR